MVAENVLQLIAEGLGNKGAFDDAFGEDALQVQRLTRYPPSNQIEDKKPGEIGSGTHSDYGGITVLYASGPGLKVLHPNRTANKVDLTGDTERYSLAFFLDPKPDAVLKPIAKF